MEYAFRHLHGAGVRGFVINTHHLPEAYAAAFPGSLWQGCPLSFFHEKILLETGGGLANVQHVFRDDGPFFVYNGDVFTDLPLAPAMERHLSDGNLVTLILRSQGPVRNVAMDAGSRRILDLRNARGTHHPDQYQFTGLCIIDPAFFRYLPPAGAIESVVAAWLRAIEAGERLGGAVIDEGLWLDLGDRASYLEAHRLIAAEPRIHPSAVISETAEIDAASSIGAGCVVESGAILRGTVLWPGARVTAGARLEACVVMAGRTAGGIHTGADF